MALQTCLIERPQLALTTLAEAISSSLPESSRHMHLYRNLSLALTQEILWYNGCFNMLSLICCRLQWEGVVHISTVATTKQGILWP
jgi:hypothetical protein